MSTSVHLCFLIAGALCPRVLWPTSSYSHCHSWPSGALPQTMKQNKPLLKSHLLGSLSQQRDQQLLHLVKHHSPLKRSPWMSVQELILKLRRINRVSSFNRISTPCPFYYVNQYVWTKKIVNGFPWTQYCLILKCEGICWKHIRRPLHPYCESFALISRCCHNKSPQMRCFEAVPIIMSSFCISEIWQPHWFL